uniref:Uncharacterized protein n=1 Tax=Rhizophora mucronata TaxID=61149 RepID=A0A2P2NQ02_RHIMU
MTGLRLQEKKRKLKHCVGSNTMRQLGNRKLNQLYDYVNHVHG